MILKQIPKQILKHGSSSRYFQPSQTTVSDPESLAWRA
ncbi:hypothetical protein VD0001_g8079 [Verticillium dahliae]|nr:hypothetical protein VD0001_g8079 [Verticillium dahliae]